ncbi:uncharacterized protein OCT59_008295 [Rhizophagus irregularis]|uniref:uncharacterized protein n=1 Tax=Rhizophagus irregularis TaxID=588596 RepID=UPI00331E8DBE|nr:hypothetical protein OCT59_008295 [Rhizophagus irregularis]
MYNNYTRDPNKEIALKCLRNSQYSIDFLIIEANKYLTNNEGFHKLYGISQNPDTNDYILVQNNSINVTNCISINEKIDNFIQEMQLKMDKYIDTVFEWIPYNQFNEIKETCKNDSITVYSAIWKDGPLQYNNEYNSFTRDSNKKVALKCFCHLQYSIDFLMNEAKKYSRFDEIKEIGKNGSITVYSAIWMDGPLCYNYKYFVSYSTSYTRNPNKEVTFKYLHNSQSAIDFVINKAENYLTNIYDGSIFVLYGISQNPDTNDYILVLSNFFWENGNKKIDNFIQKMQSLYKSNVLFEWIPYNQIYEFKEIGKNDSITAYSAIWKDGPLLYSNYGRNPNKEVVLKCLHNSHSTIDFVISEAEKYLINTYGYKDIYIIYGISQNPDTNDYIFVLSNFIWESGYKKIDDFIQKMQLKMKESSYKDNLFEWIPYNQLNEIKEIGKNGSITIYSAIWKDGPLYYNKDKEYSNYSRVSNKAVALKYLYNSQNTIEFVINKVVEYSKSTFGIRDFVIYGISQNPETNDYILVLNNYIWESGNEKIDEFIQEMHIKMMGAYENTVFEWIPYNQLNEIKEIDKSSFISIYSAIWKDGPLYRNKNCRNYTRDSNLEVALRCLHGSQNTIEIVRNEAEKYLINEFSKEIFDIYGISQNPNTNDYVLVLNNFMSVSENKKIDNFIQEINFNTNIIFEWIPYNRLNEIKKVSENDLITVYSAIWKDGPIYYNNLKDKYTRYSNEKVALKYLHSSENSIDFLINEAEKYFATKFEREICDIYGISQNLNTNDYILVIAWASGNEKIDDFIKEMQLKMSTNKDSVFEWVPYDQLNEIKEIGKNTSISIYSAIWKDGPLYYDDQNSIDYTRDPNKEVSLKYLQNTQNSVESLIKEAKKYLTKNGAFMLLYGISQNPNTNDYILIKNNYLNLANWISGNEKIDDFVQEMQLKLDSYEDIVFEWIPYNQFNNINEIGKGGFAIVYSANWKDGPLEYFADEKTYKRNDPNRVIALKCLHNSQNITNKFLNEAKEYSITKGSNITNIYGISQNPDTKDYILILDYAKDGNFNNWMNENYEYFIWQNKLSVLYMGLCGEVGYVDEKNIYGVMPYVAPEVLRGKAFTQAADIYSFDICNGNRPELNEPEAPKCYIDLMKKCLDSNPNNRPSIIEINELILSFRKSYGGDIFIVENEEIETQFKEAEEYRKASANLSSIKDYKAATHPQAIYISRLLYPFTKDLPNYNDNDDDYNSECLDCKI